MKFVRLLAAAPLVAATLISVPAASAVEPPPYDILHDCGLDGLIPPEELVGFNVIVGTAGNDMLTGTNGADYICAGAGNDTIYGLAGADFLAGDGIIFQPNNGPTASSQGFGNDTVYGGNGDDELFVGFGNDKAYGENGNDFLPLAVGNDEGYGGSGNDQIIGGHGVDIVDGGNGDDNLSGGFGNDKINGANGDDVLYGELPEGFTAPPGAEQPASDNDLCDGARGSDLAAECDVTLNVEGPAPIAPPEE